MAYSRFRRRRRARSGERNACSARSALAPDLPTVAESGLPGYDVSSWFGVFAPAGTASAVVDKWNAEIAKIVGSPEVAKAWRAQGSTPMTMGVDEFTQYMNDDIAKWAQIVKISGAKAE